MKILLSGVNLVEGGPLKVFKDAISAFNTLDVELYCIVNKKSLFSEFLTSNIIFLEYPEVKKYWYKRIIFEYIECKNICSQINPDIWFSMHDMTPILNESVKQFVYCHNPSPFYKAKFIDYRFDFSFSIFTVFYKWIYRFNIKSNKALVVQQSWLSKYFKEEFDVKDVFIAKPSVFISKFDVDERNFKEKINLFYPALPRTFKNFEILLKALSYLKSHNEIIYNKLSLTLTIDKNMGSYANYLYSKYKYLENVNFIGSLSREEVDNYYNDCDVVIFPSKLETWGLPISEAKEFNKPILLSDLPYSYETVGSYHSVLFFDPEDYKNLANIFTDLTLQNKNVFQPVDFIESDKIIHTWVELANKIVNCANQ